MCFGVSGASEKLLDEGRAAIVNGSVDTRENTGGLMKLDLTDDEIVALDGKCRPKVQAEVDAARARLATVADVEGLELHYTHFIAKVVQSANETGRVTFSPRRLQYCNVCCRSGGYAKYKRSSRSHRKGDSDHSRPLTMSGVDFNAGFVVIEGYASLGCCSKCLDRVKPILVEKLKGLRAEVPSALTGEPARFKRYGRRRCTKCKWRGHEGQLEMLTSMMGGYYPGKCPSCGASNLFFGATLIRPEEGFDVVPIETPGA